MLYNVPILFIIFKRPEVSQQSFEQIRQIKPKKLYISSDGPRETIEGEAELVEQTRSLILSKIDWDCELKTLFHDNNLGCGMGVFTAISWFFNKEVKGIILEEDCVANHSFFIYMEEMLERYDTDDRIGMVAGYNKIKQLCSDDSYFFSRYCSCWGWGTWKRAWNNMDINMGWRNTNYQKSIIKNTGYGRLEKRFWLKCLEAIDKKYVSAWDYQWIFSLSAQNQLCVYPKVNLIENIGFGIDATHTSFKYNDDFSLELEFPLVHPKSVFPNESFEKALYKMNNTFIVKVKDMLPRRIVLFLKKIILK